MEQLIERFETLGADVALFAARYVEEQYIEGQMVRFRSDRAQIRAIGLLATVLRTSDGADHTLPNAMFMRESIQARLEELVLTAGNMPRVRERIL